MAFTEEEIEQMINDCESRESRLSGWESEFIASISIAFSDWRRLSEKQEEVLDRIWETVTKDG